MHILRVFFGCKMETIPCENEVNLEMGGNANRA